MRSVSDNDVTIREARTPEEFAEVRQLFLEYAAEFGWELDPASMLAREIEDLPGPYAAPRGVILVARVNEDVAGVLGLQPIPAAARARGSETESFGELKRLYVRPKYRRLGLARALMRRAEEEGRVRGYESLVLTTSAELMPLAQNLYDSLGYSTTPPYRTDLPWPDIRWLKLDL